MILSIIEVQALFHVRLTIGHENFRAPYTLIQSRADSLSQASELRFFERSPARLSCEDDASVGYSSKIRGAPFCM